MAATGMKGSVPMEIAEQILADLIGQGYSGDELLKHFKQAQSKVRPAVEEMIGEAEKVAASISEYESFDDVFGGEGKG